MGGPAHRESGQGAARGAQKGRINTCLHYLSSMGAVLLESCVLSFWSKVGRGRRL